MRSEHPRPAIHPDQPVPYTLTPKAHAALATTGHQPTAVWRHVATLVAWLDAANPRTDHEIACRVMKLAEETGEAVAAYIGMTGQNPREGTCATPGDLASELCDVIVTAMVALATLTSTSEAEAHLAAQLVCLVDRTSPGPTPGRWCHDCDHPYPSCAGCGWSCLRCGAAYFGNEPERGLCPDCLAARGAR
jgi:hypothetical protein